MILIIEFIRIYDLYFHKKPNSLRITVYKTMALYRVLKTKEGLPAYLTSNESRRLLVKLLIRAGDNAREA